MEDKGIEKIVGIISIIIGLGLFLYSLSSLVGGFSEGFKFHLWNINLFGQEALITNLVFILFSIVIVISGVRRLYYVSNYKVNP